MNQTIEWKKTQPGSTEAVQFSDGMLVTAEDLTQAMRYPLSVIQVLLKAYFGCGIVCGLDLKHPDENQSAETEEDGAESTGETEQRECAANFILTVEKGVALGCDGYPVEICGPLKLDLTPDPCRRDPTKAQVMWIAARRVTAAEAAARPCGCGPTGGEPAQQCSRMRDHALVQAFGDRPPTDICRAAPAAEDDAGEAGQKPVRGEAPTGPAALRDCLRKCGECACCGEPWVLLGSVLVTRQGLRTIDRSGRRYVKPIACHCEAVTGDQAQPPTPATDNSGTSTASGTGRGRVTDSATIRQKR
ncbi:MAG TPA: hypothetical protein VD846_06085 [Allosphingosinicella sp.]|nr:hypothetical protein [Allosphingosinicella sp.]